jgi:outer membrane protein OmpA-like peptidoglycan-associated protein
LWPKSGNYGRKKNPYHLPEMASPRVLPLSSLEVRAMSKLSPLLLATTVILTTSTSVFGMPQKVSSPSDSSFSFSVFFDPGRATLSKEGREIISVVAKRFAATHSRNPAAHIFVTSETDDQDSASLSIERIKVVGNQFARDGIPRKFISADEQPSVHAEPVRLLEWLDRRVLINIQENPDTGRIVG